jgi:hypothetical protein
MAVCYAKKTLTPVWLHTQPSWITYYAPGSIPGQMDGQSPYFG